MITILNCFIFYSILFFLDLLPLFRGKQKFYRWFMGIVFAVTLVYNILLSLGMPFVSVTAVLMSLLPKIQK
ncbi:MAG TPA: hypothetical protein DEP64_08750 [Ruminococcaceae bacterium]|nr:hypothetical protein [Oscillospiraceae bacterium]